MATQIGTYDISLLLAARFQSAAQFGLDTIQKILEADLAAYNFITEELLREMCDVTSDRQRKYGSSVSGEMVEVDEFGRSPTQNPVVGSTGGYPLRLFQFALGWTEKWFEIGTPADMAQASLAAQSAHQRAIHREIKRAIYGSANYTWNDFLVDKVDLAVKRLVNADSAPIPNGPNGEIFDAATHTHYDAVAGITAPTLKAAVQDVVEHGHGGNVKIAINRADEAAVRGLTGFTAYADPRTVNLSTTLGPTKPLDIARLDNRAIGTFEGAEVWCKPWALQYYPFVWDAASPNKPLAFRQRSQNTLQGLRISATLKTHPLIAQYMEAEYGIGVWTRTNGAVLFTNGGAYADPTIS